jgi:hypothetical protein
MTQRRGRGPGRADEETPGLDGLDGLDAFEPFDALEDPSEDELPAAERARMRRRDHDASAHDRALMNDGSAKWFKQALERQERGLREARARRHPAE